MSRNGGERDLSKPLFFFPYKILTVIRDYIDEKDWHAVANEKLRGLASKYPDEQIWLVENFLVGKKWDVSVAEKQLKEALEKKRTEILDPVFIEEAKHILGPIGKKCAIQFFGKAKNGTQIIATQLCKIPETCVEHPDKVARALACYYELYCVQENPFQRPRATILGSTNAVNGAPNIAATRLMGILKSMVGIMQKCYPENADTVVVFPFPWIGRALWNVIYYFMDPHTRDKVNFLGGSTSRHSEPHDGLYEFVDKKELPEDWLESIED